jgi:hypothetical protein
MTYDNAKEMFERLARAAGFTARPHMLRHGAATGWLRDGTPRDVVQELLGHVSQASMQPYIHVSDQEKHHAVERVGVGVPAERVRTVPNGLDVPEFDSRLTQARQTRVFEAVRARNGLPATAPVVLMSARRVAWKGHEGVIDAVGILARRGIDDFVVLDAMTVEHQHLRSGWETPPATRWADLAGRPCGDQADACHLADPLVREDLVILGEVAAALRLLGRVPDLPLAPLLQFWLCVLEDLQVVHPTILTVGRVPRFPSPRGSVLSTTQRLGKITNRVASPTA